MFKYEEDTLVLQRSLLNDKEREHSALEKLRDIQHKQERLAEKVEEHGRRNEMCRGQIPHALLDSVGGGFNDRMQKNVGFADMVNHECENYFLPDLLRTESTSMLIDLILQRALQCRGEQVLVLVTDCCGSNYNGTVWAFAVYLVDELKWFKAVVLLYYMLRHGKGLSDQFFGGHKSAWESTDAMSADQLAQYYIDASSAGKENVVHVMPHAVCDWKSWLEEKYASRTAQQLGVQALRFNQVIAIRSSIEQTLSLRKSRTGCDLSLQILGGTAHAKAMKRCINIWFFRPHRSQVSKGESHILCFPRLSIRSTRRVTWVIRNTRSIERMR